MLLEKQSPVLKLKLAGNFNRMPFNVQITKIMLSWRQGHVFMIFKFSWTVMQTWPWRKGDTYVFFVFFAPFRPFCPLDFFVFLGFWRNPWLFCFINFLSAWSQKFAGVGKLIYKVGWYLVRSNKIKKITSNETHCSNSTSKH